MRFLLAHLTHEWDDTYMYYIVFLTFNLHIEKRGKKASTVILDVEKAFAI